MLKRGCLETLPTPRDPYAAFRHRDFRLLFLGRVITTFAGQMLNFAIMWEIWLRTHSTFALGLVGLVQVVPIILLSLPGGHIADQYNRKRIVIVMQGVLIACSLGLAYLSYIEGPLVWIYACLLGIGIARAFYDPAASTLLPQTIPPSLFTSAATWSSSAWQFAAIVGPTVAGFIVAVFKNVTVIYVFDAVAAGIFIFLLSLIRGRELALARKATTLESLLEGWNFIKNTRVLLAAITLDMFAVLFGGAVALLPVYATDILQVGPTGLGIMRAAPSIGAILMAFALAHLPPMKQAGKTLLWAVAGFGIATIVFGVSRSFWLSILMLGLLGGLDNISVVIRHTLMLTRVPDEMRGRASAVNSIFISTSNEMGAFESGSVAALIGTTPSVVLGGVGTILVVLAVAGVFPEMREMKSLDVPPVEPS
ncbi:MAG: MFS transporter [Chloroflexi bacterium]|nr:MFS transporter [Chloroflexota bacterium]